MNKILSNIFCLTLLLPILASGQKYEKTILQDSMFNFVIKGDSANLDRFQLYIKYSDVRNDSISLKNEAGKVNIITIDTLLDNLTNTAFAPMHLEYVGLYNSYYICIIYKTESSFHYRIYRRESKWTYYYDKVLDWRDYRFSTTLKVRDCFHIEMRNGYGDFMWTIDPEAKSFIKSEIKSEKH